jgi:hypothetical protein
MPKSLRGIEEILLFCRFKSAILVAKLLASAIFLAISSTSVGVFKTVPAGGTLDEPPPELEPAPEPEPKPEPKGKKPSKPFEAKKDYKNGAKKSGKGDN